MRKISILISIVLISLLAISAVSAADDVALTDDADLGAADEIQAIEHRKSLDIGHPTALFLVQPPHPS